MHGNGGVDCPFCRQTSTPSNVDNLPNNWHAIKLQHAALQVLKLKEEVDSIKDESMCLKELSEMKETRQTKLVMDIQERHEVQQQMTQILNSFDAAGKEVQQLKDENDLRLTEIISKLMETINVEDESESMSLVDDSSLVDTAEMLKMNMNKSVDLIAQKLLQDIAKVFDVQHGREITVQLHDENDEANTDRRRDVPALPLISPPAPGNTFILGQSIFILRLFKSDGTLEGEIQVRPVPTFHPEFVQKLINFCFNDPKYFCISDLKVS